MALTEFRRRRRPGPPVTPLALVIWAAPFLAVTLLVALQGCF